MPVTLNRTIEPVVLDSAKVVAFKVENNLEHWIELWVSFGQLVGGNFAEYRDPDTGATIPPAYLKIEDGHHPLSPDMALRKCAACDLWYRLELECPACSGPTAAYDGFSRLVGGSPPPGGNLHDVISTAIYAFLVGESVPDPDSWELVRLLDAE